MTRNRICTAQLHTYRPIICNFIRQKIEGVWRCTWRCDKLAQQCMNILAIVDVDCKANLLPSVKCSVLRRNNASWILRFDVFSHSRVLHFSFQPQAKRKNSNYRKMPSLNSASKQHRWVEVLAPSMAEPSRVCEYVVRRHMRVRSKALLTILGPWMKYQI